MWRERITRIVIVALLMVLVLAIIKGLRDKDGGLVGAQIKEKIENFSEEILGKAIEKLPGAPDLEKADEGQVAGDSNESETEPINQPVENIQTQVQQIIESIKYLPQDQVEAVKKQFYKEVCENWVTQEITEEEATSSD